jgi:hypothetical protein
MLMAHAERVPPLPSGAAQLLAEMAGLLEFQWSDGRRGSSPQERRCGRMLMAHAEGVPALPSGAAQLLALPSATAQLLALPSGVAQLLAEMAELLEFRWSDDRGGPLPLERRCDR